MKCDLVFTKSNKSILSRIINTLTEGNISHVAILINDQNSKIIEATSKGIVINDFDKKDKIIVRIKDLTDEQKNNILMSASYQVTKKTRYDFGLFFTIMLNRWFGIIPKDDYKKFICSEFILNIFIKNGINLLSNTKYSNKDNVTPYELYCGLVNSGDIEFMEVLS